MSKTSEPLPDELESARLEVKRVISGSQLTTIAIGGMIECLFEPNNLEEIARAYKITAPHFPWRLLGAGSNLLISDEGISGGVLKLGRGFRSVTPLGNGVFKVGGAVSLINLSSKLSQQGFAGLEFAGGIPASFGGAIAMNAGAHGGEMACILREVEVWTPQEGCLQLHTEELNFAYRRATLPAKGIVVGATIKLTPSVPAKTMERRASCLAARKASQPLNLPSAGSIFKNPAPEKSAGWLLDTLGLKGEKVGGAEISKLHANWIVNPHKQATSRDVKSLMLLCMDRVKENYGIELEKEVKEWEE